MKAIIKREFLSYFMSPLGYVYLAIFFVFSGIYFLAFCLLDSGSNNLTYVFSSLFSIVIFLVPIITMRLWSEEKKQKTDQALFTAPIRLTSAVMGKYLGAMSIYAVSISVTLIYALVISIFTDADWPVVLTNFLGLLLLGCALIAIGMFISSLTENQIIAALISFATGLLIVMLNSIASFVNVSFLSSIFTNISFNTHYQSFTSGILNIVDIVFFLSVAAIFVFLTVRVFEKKRWS